MALIPPILGPLSYGITPTDEEEADGMEPDVLEAMSTGYRRQAEDAALAAKRARAEAARRAKARKEGVRAGTQAYNANLKTPAEKRVPTAFGTGALGPLPTPAPTATAASDEFENEPDEVLEREIAARGRGDATAAGLQFMLARRRAARAAANLPRSGWAQSLTTPAMAERGAALPAALMPAPATASQYEPRPLTGPLGQVAPGAAAPPELRPPGTTVEGRPYYPAGELMAPMGAPSTAAAPNMPALAPLTRPAEGEALPTPTPPETPMAGKPPVIREGGTAVLVRAPSGVAVTLDKDFYRTGSPEAVTAAVEKRATGLRVSAAEPARPLRSLTRAQYAAEMGGEYGGRGGVTLPAYQGLRGLGPTPGRSSVESGFGIVPSRTAEGKVNRITSENAAVAGRALDFERNPQMAAAYRQEQALVDEAEVLQSDIPTITAKYGVTPEKAAEWKQRALVNRQRVTDILREKADIRAGASRGRMGEAIRGAIDRGAGAAVDDTIAWNKVLEDSGVAIADDARLQQPYAALKAAVEDYQATRDAPGADPALVAQKRAAMQAVGERYLTLIRADYPQIAEAVKAMRAANATAENFRQMEMGVGFTEPTQPPQTVPGSMLPLTPPPAAPGPEQTRPPIVFGGEARAPMARPYAPLPGGAEIRALPHPLEDRAPYVTNLPYSPEGFERAPRPPEDVAADVKALQAAGIPPQEKPIVPMTRLEFQARDTGPLAFGTKFVETAPGAFKSIPLTGQPIKGAERYKAMGEAERTRVAAVAEAAKPKPIDVAAARIDKAADAAMRANPNTTAGRNMAQRHAADAEQARTTLVATGTAALRKLATPDAVDTYANEFVAAHANRLGTEVRLKSFWTAVDNYKKTLDKQSGWAEVADVPEKFEKMHGEIMTRWETTTDKEAKSIVDKRDKAIHDTDAHNMRYPNDKRELPPRITYEDARAIVKERHGGADFSPLGGLLAPKQLIGHLRKAGLWHDQAEALAAAALDKNALPSERAAAWATIKGALRERNYDVSAGIKSNTSTGEGWWKPDSPDTLREAEAPATAPTPPASPAVPAGAPTQEQLRRLEAIRHKDPQADAALKALGR